MPMSSLSINPSAWASRMPNTASKWCVSQWRDSDGHRVSHTIPQSSTAEAAKDISAFIVIFFEHFSKFKGRPFHFAGESYGVRVSR